jgi:hypothetical protein
LTDLTCAGGFCWLGSTIINAGASLASR